MTTDEILAARDVVRQVFVDDKVKRYAVDLVAATRDPKASGLAAARAADRQRRLAARVDRADQGREGAGAARRPRLHLAARREDDRARRAAPPHPRQLRGRSAGQDHRSRHRADPRERPRSLRSPCCPPRSRKPSSASSSSPAARSSDVMAGAYLSVFKGRGMEFDEVRPYVPGDDVRAIDWNVTARTGEPHIKRFVEERELTVMLLVDVQRVAGLRLGPAQQARGGGRAVGAARDERRRERRQGRPAAVPRRRRPLHPAAQGRQARAARRARGARARRGDADGPRRAAALLELPRIRAAVVREAAATRRAHEPRRSTSIAAALEFCRQVLPRRAVLFLISDFLDDGYLQVLRHANRKHDVVAALITDPREAEMPPAGLVTLEDAESGRDAARRHAVGARSATSSRSARRRAQKDAARSAARDGHGPRRVRCVGLDGRSAAEVLPRARAEAARDEAAACSLALVACGRARACSIDAARRPTIEPPKDAIAKISRERPGQGDGRGVAGEADARRADLPAARRSTRRPASASTRRSRRRAISGSAGSRSSGSCATRSASPTAAQHQEQTYTLEAPSSGKHRIPPLRLEMVDARGDAGNATGEARRRS